jgi:hypothetical protein
MMHGGGKSDSAVVAVKPTNKACSRLQSRWTGSTKRGPRSSSNIRRGNSGG